MADSTRQQLQQAYELIKARRKAEARSALETLLTANPRQVDGYYLYSLAAPTPDKAREALAIALELDPGHARSLRALAQLNARYPQPAQPTVPPPPPKPAPASTAPAPVITIAPLTGSAPAPPRSMAPAPAADAGDDEPPDALFPVEEETTDGPVSAAEIKLAAIRRMNLPVASLMAIGIGVVMIVAAVLLVLAAT